MQGWYAGLPMVRTDTRRSNQVWAIGLVKLLVPSPRPVLEQPSWCSFSRTTCPHDLRARPPCTTMLQHPWLRAQPLRTTVPTPMRKTSAHNLLCTTTSSLCTNEIIKYDRVFARPSSGEYTHRPQGRDGWAASQKRHLEWTLVGWPECKDFHRKLVLQGRDGWAASQKRHLE